MIPPSPTGRRALRSLALHHLARHAAYPDIHPATANSLISANYVTGDHARHELRLTVQGWTAVGEIVGREVAP